MILGDLNAGCSYVTIKGWRAVRLRSDPKFRWLIGDEQDTTVREKTHCAYDRSVTAEGSDTGINLIIPVQCGCCMHLYTLHFSHDTPMWIFFSAEGVMSYSLVFIFHPKIGSLFMDMRFFPV